MNYKLKKRYVTLIDPFMLNHLHAIIGRSLLVQTTKDTLRGHLTNVQPDHIILFSSPSETIVHLDQIVSIMPE